MRSNHFRTLNEQLRRCKTALEVERLVWQNRDYNAVNVATALNQLKLTKSTNPQTLNRLLNVASASREKFDPQALSVACHSIASGGLLPKLPQVLLRKVGESDLGTYSPQSLCNVLTSFALLHQPFPNLSDFAKEVHSRPLHTFNNHDLTDLVWAFGELGLDTDLKVVVLRIMDHLQPRLAVCTPKQLVRVVVGLGKLGFPQPDLVLSELATRTLPPNLQLEVDQVPYKPLL
ncbi:hypothetical protein BASA81_012621 [Batrachochytrium salamandrivorans]|nr:hypothetical protein BASA81_012621 [Batrachochytrium salamandrivorans]